MEKEPVIFYKRRSVGEIISDSFLFLKQEFKPLSKLTLIYILPFLVLYGIVHVFIQKKLNINLDMTDQERLTENLGYFYKHVFILLLFNTFIQSLMLGTFYTYLDFYLKRGKNGFTVSEITPYFFGNSLKIIAASFLVLFLFISGLIFCIIPGIVIGVTLSLTFIILIVEGTSISESLVKSWKLVIPNWFDVFIVNLTGVFFIIIIILVFSIPALFAGVNVFDYNGNAGEPVVLPEWYWVVSAVGNVVSMLAGLFIFTMLAMFYGHLNASGRNDSLM